MTVIVNKEQNDALAMLNVALYKATNSGLLDLLAVELHPDRINEFCDAVGALCKEAQESPESNALPYGHNAPHGLEATAH